VYARREARIHGITENNGSGWPNANPTKAADTRYNTTPESASYITVTPTKTTVGTGRE
jgi:hypothetical protein